MTWQGICKNCGAIASLEEHILIPDKPKASPSQKSIIRRSKNSERNIAKKMVAIDGPDLNYKGIASSTGRIGHVTALRADAISANYLTENKNRKIPTWMAAAWLLIQQRSIDFGKYALLHIEPPNTPKDFPLNGQKYKMSTLHIITQDRHQQLIEEEKVIQALNETFTPDKTDAQLLYEIRELLGQHK